MANSTWSQARIEQAETQLTEALANLRQTVQATYPPGTVVRVQKGRSNVQAEVTHYPGSNPAVFSAFNLKTGINTTYHWRDVQEILGKRGPQGSIVPLED